MVPSIPMLSITSAVSAGLAALLTLLILKTPGLPQMQLGISKASGQSFLTVSVLLLCTFLYVMLVAMLVSPIYSWFTHWYLDAVARWLVFV